jgi:hypothetical protein
MDIHFVFVADFSSKGGFFWGNAHARMAGKISHRLVRGLLQTSNMAMEFNDPSGVRAGDGSHRYCGSKIPENFCGIFALLCYIPAPLTNRN